MCVVKTLADGGKGEEERREAAGVLAQVLSPWIDGNTSHQQIDDNLPDIVISLKGKTKLLKFVNDNRNLFKMKKIFV